MEISELEVIGTFVVNTRCEDMLNEVAVEDCLPENEIVRFAEIIADYI